MSASPLERGARQAQREAERASRQLGRLFGQLGDLGHPRGLILTAYRRARQALRAARQDPQLVELVLADLERELREIAGNVLEQAFGIGAAQGEATLAGYGLAAAPGATLAGIGTRQEALTAWMEATRGQLSTVRALARGGEWGLILGDLTRAGALAPWPTLREGRRWLALMTQAAAEGIYQGLPGAVAEEYRRQAIAGLDERTTDCCLRVHGQIVGMREPFTLTGTPRFADRVMRPPFHWN